MFDVDIFEKILIVAEVISETFPDTQTSEFLDTYHWNIYPFGRKVLKNNYIQIELVGPDKKGVSAAVVGPMGETLWERAGRVENFLTLLKLAKVKFSSIALNSKREGR